MGTSAQQEHTQTAAVQWIRKPPLDWVYQVQEDIDSLATRITDKDAGVLEDYMNLWRRNIQEVLDKLRDTIPGEGMLAEIHYWRDLSRILQALDLEVRQSFVEVTLQLVRELAPKHSSYSQCLDLFSRQKNRVTKGAKEAKWNYKYLKVIEMPVT